MTSSEFQDLDEKCDHLDWSGEGPKTFVRLLSERPSWREDKLEEEYYKAVGATFRLGNSNFRTLATQFLEYGLIKEDKTKTGYRFSLNKAVWEQDSKLFEVLGVVVRFFDRQLRADCKLSTILKHAVEKLDGTPYGGLHHTIIYPIAGTIAGKLRDFSRDTSVQRYRFAKRRPEQIKAAQKIGPQSRYGKQRELFSSSKPRSSKEKPKAPQPQTPADPVSSPENVPYSLTSEATLSSAMPQPDTGSVSDTPAGLPRGCVRLADPVATWQPLLKKLDDEMLSASSFADQQAIITEMHVTAARKQRVMLAVMKRLSKCYFLVFSLCGVASPEIDFAEVMSAVDIDPTGIHLSVLNIDGERFVGVIQVIPLSLDQSFFDPIKGVGKLADQLEASFWGVDEY